MGQVGLELQHLKRVSRVKHQILTRYLPSWAKILGSAFNKLYYVDCFAGPGIYEAGGEQVDGSPVIAVKVAKEFAANNARKKLGVILVDDNESQIELLKTRIATTEPHTDNLKVCYTSGRFSYLHP
jgi:three-Cys-motif partner protein